MLRAGVDLKSVSERLGQLSLEVIDSEGLAERGGFEPPVEVYAPTTV